ncbi:unnamed protein product [Somion occarium]|uniref:Phosphoglycerate mutase-like protein n=1 Tax=Somion occarium TaxID=3059160 RepID=A0ABP1E9Q0_9APHY
MVALFGAAGVLLGLPLLVSAAPSGYILERRDFDFEAHLGNLSPYHKAPLQSGLKADLPADCKVEQVVLMHRHGSRFPLSNELPFITNLVSKLSNNSAAIQKAKLPDNLAFLKEGYTTTLGVNDLTAPGRAQLFQHGVALRLKYPQFEGTTVLAGLQDRVIESAQWFAQGYFGREWTSLNATAFSTLPEDNQTVSWITPDWTCPNWDYNFGNNLTVEWGQLYLPPIAKRLNKVIPGLNLTSDDAHGALFACAYDLAAHGISPWCSAFTQSEIQDFEYELDLLMNGAFGYGLPGDMGPILGAVYVNTLIERLTNGSGTALPIYLEFGHDTSIDLALTGLGYVKDSPPLRNSANGPIRTNRKWRTSSQVPFAAQMVWEKFTCSSSYVIFFFSCSAVCLVLICTYMVSLLVIDSEARKCVYC